MCSEARSAHVNIARGAGGLCAALVACASLCARAASIAGESDFSLPTSRGDVAVRVYQPAAATADSPVWIVMHGLQRDGAQCLEQWRPAAERARAVLVVPTFDRAHWPTSKEYPIGDVLDSRDRPRERSQWAFAAVDRIFEEAARRTGSHRRAFTLYGHGAGAQFVQRYVLLGGGTRLDGAVAAAAGWYMLDDDAVDFPYGLRGLPVAEDTLRTAYATPFTVMVGSDDVKTSGVMRDNESTRRQGANRVERARRFVENARTRAARMHAPFRWRFVEVAGVGHEPDAMLPAAEEAVAHIHR